MEVGLGRVDITPPLGIELAGYGMFRRRTATAVHDPLFARAVLFASGGRQALLINLDLIAMSLELVVEVKGQIEHATGIAAGDVMIACIHSHSAPTACPMLGCGEMLASYVASLGPAIVEASKAAQRDLDDARSVRHFAAPFGGIGYNRTSPHEGAVDRRLRGVEVVRQNRPPILLPSYGCHPVTLGANHEVSADYPGQVCAVLGEMGYLGVLFNGCHGDIDPLTHRAAWGSGTFETIRRYGEIIVAAAMRELGADARPTDGLLASAHDTATLPTEVPDAETVRRVLAEADAQLLEHPLDAHALFNRTWAGRALALLESGQASDAVEMPIQALRVGEVVFVALPGEIFTEFGMAIADAAPDVNVFVLSNANGTISYVPTREDLARGGYAGTRANHIYGRFQFKPDVGERMMAVANRLVAQVLEESQS